MVLVHPAVDGLGGYARIPYSKPHMQRSILLGLLANTPSVVLNPAWSSEARSLFEAAQRLGMTVADQTAHQVSFCGVGRSVQVPGTALESIGSAFNLRTMAAVAALAKGETVLEGNASMLARPVRDYLGFITELGGDVEDLSTSRSLRIRVRGSRRLGGTAHIDTRHSSQVLTSLLLVAPLAEDPVRINCSPGQGVGQGYIDLTVAMMRDRGASVESTESGFVIRPGMYRSGVHEIASDFTALSYLAGTVAAAESGHVTIEDYIPSQLGPEQEFLRVLRQLGIRTTHEAATHSLLIERVEPTSRHVEIDARNIPTVVPTLAAMAPFVEPQVTVHHAAHVNNHKCRRVDMMLEQLQHMGCNIAPTYTADGEVDGFGVPHGRQEPVGGVTAESYGDHRIFMSLATAALGARLSTAINGAEHLHASFPDYFTVLERVGADFDAARTPGGVLAPAH